MRKIRLFIAGVMLVAGAASLQATELNCQGSAANIEEFRYSWRLRGGLRWIAGLIVPTSGVGNLRTVFPATGSPSISSELLITAPRGKSDGFFHYASEMEPSGLKTLMTSSGYAWAGTAREEKTNFDYTERVARIRKATPEKVETKVRPLPDGQMRDILTAIYFLRQNAPRITAPLTTKIYSDGKEYPVVFRPSDGKTFEVGGQRVASTAFEIVDAPGGKKWPGNVKVFISNDSRRIPLRIDITRSAMAALQLDLESIEACGFMQALK